MHVSKKLIAIIIFFVSSLMPSSVIGMDNTSDDPPIFHMISKDGINIYIIGSPHSISLEKLFNHTVIGIIKNISQSKTHLYVEHAIKTDEYLDYINVNQLAIETNFQRLHITNSNKNTLKGMLDDHIYSGISDGKISNSDYKFEILKCAELCLAAPVLGIHSSILCYNKFGGLEYEFLESNDFKREWKSINFLELPADMIKSSLANKAEDYDHNKSWCNQSLTKIKAFRDNDLNKLEIIEIEIRNHKKGYSWNIIEDNKTPIIQGSKERSKHWVDSIPDKIKNLPQGEPVLIVIGTGHMFGTGHDAGNFIDLLSAKLGSKELRRLTQHGEWTIVKR